MLRWLLWVLATSICLPAQAQLTAPVRNGDTTITVTGRKTRDVRPFGAEQAQ